MDILSLERIVFVPIIIIEDNNSQLIQYEILKKLVTYI